MREHTASFRKAMEAVLAKDASLRAQASELRVLKDDGFLSEIDSEDDHDVVLAKVERARQRQDHARQTSTVASSGTRTRASPSTAALWRGGKVTARMSRRGGRSSSRGMARFYSRS